MQPTIFAFSLFYSSYSSSIIFHIPRIRHTTSTDFTDSRRHNRSLTDITDLLPNIPTLPTKSINYRTHPDIARARLVCMTTRRLHIQCHYANSPSTSISLCFRSSSVGLHNCLTIEFPFCFISCNNILFCFISRNYVPFLSDFLQPYFLFVLLSLTFLFDHLPKIPIKTSVKLLSSKYSSRFALHSSPLNKSLLPYIKALKNSIFYL